MNKYLTKKFILVSIFLIFSFKVYGEASRKKFGIGLNYPGLSIRYAANKKFTFEIKGQLDEEILVAGTRFYYYFASIFGVYPLLGIEGDYIFYKGDISEGMGFVAELFSGVEIFVLKNLSLQVDIGPAFIMLSDKNYKKSVVGVEFIINLGINWYLGKEIK